MTDVFENYRYAYIEFHVGMAKMVAYWHVKALGFELVGYRGPETGHSDTLSFLMEKNGIRLLITSAAKPSAYDVLSFVDRHGNAVKRIAYYVDDVNEAFQTAVERGAIPIHPPKREENEQGYVEEAAIRLFDRKEITFFNDKNYSGLFRPNFKAHSIEGFEPDFDNGFQAIDHIAYGLHTNEMDYWCGYFRKIFGSTIVQQLKSGDVASRHSGMLLNLIRSKNGLINDVFVEPENGKKLSQVQEYINASVGSGVQHMAFSTNDIFKAVADMRAKGIDLVTYPKTYFDRLRAKGTLPVELMDRVEQSNVLCDQQGDTYLFQTFTKPFGDRPTFFYEIIQRTEDYSGFALDNITELFMAVEHEQGQRSS